MAFQETVRDLDSGTTAKFLKIGMIAVLLIGLSAVYFLIQFKGLGSEAAMDQAQIAHSLILKEGFSTRYIRPLAIRVLVESKKATDMENFPEFYNAPLYPLLEAAVLFPVKNRIKMEVTDTLSMADRTIAALGIVLLFLGVFVWYRVALLLFDQTIALTAAGLLLVTDLLWQYALAGLPQLFLILLFGMTTLFSIHAKKADEEEALIPSLLWLAAASFSLGLMSLTHGVTAFLIPGFILFTLVGLNARIRSTLLALTVYLLTVFPWLVHNFLVCGNPFGLSIYVALAGAGITEGDVMRGINTGLALGGGMANKFRAGITDQGTHLWEFLGLNIVVIFFFPSLLHSFRNSVAALWRWIILIMWFGVILGMTLFGVKGAVSGNQLHVIFLPIFIIYGTTFLFVLWKRLEISAHAFRILFLTVVFLFAGTPMFLTLLGGQQKHIQWPPYVPPFITMLQNWFGPKELLSSDMPWAVAWYANRKCLLLPETVRAFDEISDYGALGTPIVGLYLTPISGQEEFINLVKGPHKEWGPVIMRTINPSDFLLKSFTPLPIDGECILYADRDRWARKSEK